MKKFFQENKIALSLISYPILILVVIYYLAIPYSRSIKEKADNIQKKSIDNEMTSKRTSEIPQMAKTSLEIEDERKVFENALLDPESEVEFIKKLESLAEETGNKMILKVVEDKNQNQGKVKKNSKDSKDEKKGIVESLSYSNYISMEIQLSGNLSQLVNFLKKIENFEYYVNVISLNIKKTPEIFSGEPPSSSGGIDPFSLPGSVQSAKNPLGENSVKKEKDVLYSTLSILIYTKK